MINLKADGISNEILDILESQGLPVKRSLDIDVPPLPTDITQVDDQELMTMASKYLQNYNFMITQVACAELAVLDAESKYNRAEAKAMLTKTTGKSTEKSIMLRAQVATDPEIMALEDTLNYAQAYSKLLKTMQEDLERCHQFTSRELTRRTSVLKARGY